MSNFHLSVFNLKEFDDEEFLADPRGASRPHFVGYVNPFCEHMLVFRRQKDPQTGLDYASAFKMDLLTDKVNKQRVIARAKLAVSTGRDDSPASRFGTS